MKQLRLVSCVSVLTDDCSVLLITETSGISIAESARHGDVGGVRQSDDEVFVLNGIIPSYIPTAVRPGAEFWSTVGGNTGWDSRDIWKRQLTQSRVEKAMELCRQPRYCADAIIGWLGSYGTYNAC